MSTYSEGGVDLLERAAQGHDRGRGRPARRRGGAEGAHVDLEAPSWRRRHRRLALERRHELAPRALERGRARGEGAVELELEVAQPPARVAEARELLLDDTGVERARAGRLEHRALHAGTATEDVLGRDHEG